MKRGIENTGAYEADYFLHPRKPAVVFGFDSIFFRINAWFRFGRVLSLIRKYLIYGKMLDVGCGIGYSVKRFSSAGLDSVGCDISKWATRETKKMVPNTDIIRTDTHFLPFKSGTFDIVTSFETFEHCINLPEVLKEIKRVTKPNGLVIASVPTTDLNNTYTDKTHVWHLSLDQWLKKLSEYFQFKEVEYFMKFMRYIDKATCTTFIVMKNDALPEKEISEN